MTLTELIFKHSTNLLALSKIRGAVITCAASWGISVGRIEVWGAIPLIISDELLEIASPEFYSNSIVKEALAYLKSNNPELFTNA